MELSNHKDFVVFTQTGENPTGDRPSQEYFMKTLKLAYETNTQTNQP